MDMIDEKNFQKRAVFSENFETNNDGYIKFNQ